MRLFSLLRGVTGTFPVSEIQYKSVIDFSEVLQKITVLDWFHCPLSWIRPINKLLIMENSQSVTQHHLCIFLLKIILWPLNQKDSKPSHFRNRTKTLWPITKGRTIRSQPFNNDQVHPYDKSGRGSQFWNTQKSNPNQPKQVLLRNRPQKYRLFFEPKAADLISVFENQ